MGQHNDEVYRELLGVKAEEQQALAAQGVAYWRLQTCRPE